MISYAQNFEDVILRRVFRDRTDGFYIDVGAMDPVFDSVTKFFYDQGWSGINIEPNEWFYNKLAQERPRDINLNVALGEADEDRPLYLFEQYGISTFEESSRDRFVEQGYEVEQRTAKVTTLAAVCQEYVTRQIDFLKIDCEGWEKFVLKGADWNRFRPIVVIVEATEPGTTIPSWSEWEPFLLEYYDMVYFDGLNRFYLRHDSAELQSNFELPPNVFDEFKAYATQAAEQASQILQRDRELLQQDHELLQRDHELLQRDHELLQRDHGLLKRDHRHLQRDHGHLQRDHGLLQRDHGLLQRDHGLLQRDHELLQRHTEGLTSQVTDLEHKLNCARLSLETVEAQAAQLDRKLLESRLWVGQLSQDRAAGKR